MKGCTLGEFIDDLLTMGGPEKEFIFRGRRYFMEAQRYEENPSLTEFVIFDGLTIYEAESEIEVLFG